MMPLRLTLLGALLLAVPHVAHMQAPQLIPESGTIGDCSFVTGDFTFECLPLYLSYLIKLAFGMAGGFATIQIVQGGYEYAISGVAAEVVAKESATKRIRNAVIGLVVVVLAYLIIDTIVSALFLG